MLGAADAPHCITCCPAAQQGVFVVLLSQLARMHPGWGVLFYCCLFQGRAWLQGICLGFSMPLDCTGGVCTGTNWGSPALEPPKFSPFRFHKRLSHPCVNSPLKALDVEENNRQLLPLAVNFCHPSSASHVLNKSQGADLGRK